MSKDFKPTRYHFNYSILVNNSIDKTWSFLTDVKRWKEWDTEIIEAKINSNFTLNAEGSFKPKSGPKLKFYISEIIPNQSYTFITKMPFCNLVIKRTLTPKENTVEFTDEIKFTGPLKKVFGLMLGGGFKAVLPEVMENFKRIVERE